MKKLILDRDHKPYIVAMTWRPLGILYKSPFVQLFSNAFTSAGFYPGVV